MKLTHRGEYALLALVFLARLPEGEIASIETIATAQKIPRKYLEQILLTLKRGGHVTSVRGKAGGYLLARDPEDITVADVVRLFEGALAPTPSVSQFFYSESPIEHEPTLVTLFREVRDLVAAHLERTTLAQLVTHHGKQRTGRSGR